MPFFLASIFYFFSLSGIFAEDKAEEGQLCIGYKDGKPVDLGCDGSKSPYYSPTETSLICRGWGSAGRAPIKNQSAEKCYADFDCASGYCHFDKDAIHIIPDTPKKLTGHGVCEVSPMGFGQSLPMSFNDKGKRLTRFPYVRSGRSENAPCEGDSQCASGVCQKVDGKGTCLGARYCLRCTKEGHTPVPGAPCCGGLGISGQSSACQLIERGLERHTDMMQVFGAAPATSFDINFPTVSDILEKSYEPLTRVKADNDGAESFGELTSLFGQNNWDVSILDSSKSCEFSYSVSGQISSSSAAEQEYFLSNQIMANKIKKELAVRSGILEILKFLYLYKHPNSETRVPFDPYGMHAGVMEIMRSLQQADIKTQKEILESELQAEVTMDINKFIHYLQSIEKNNSQKGQKGGLSSEKIAAMYGEISYGKFKTSKEDLKTFLDSHPEQLKALQNAINNPYQKGNKSSIQVQSLQLMINQANTVAASMANRAKDFSEAELALSGGKDGEVKKFKLPGVGGNKGQYAFTVKAGGSKPDPKVVNEDQYSLSEMISGRGSLIRKGFDMGEYSLLGLEDDDTDPDSDRQVNAFYKPVKDFMCKGYDKHSVPGAMEQIREIYLGGSDIASQVNEDDDWSDEHDLWYRQSYLCTGSSGAIYGGGTDIVKSYKKVGTNESEGGYRVGNSAFISTFPAYVFGRFGAMVGEWALPSLDNFDGRPDFTMAQLAVKNAQENFQNYINDPLNNIRGIDIPNNVKSDYQEKIKNKTFWTKEMQEFLENAAKSDNIFRGFLRYLSQGTPVRHRRYGDLHYDYIHPFYFAPEFLKNDMSKNILLLAIYYQKMGEAFTKREACLKDMLKKLEEVTCKGEQGNCAPGLDRSEVAAPTAVPVASTSINAKTAGGTVANTLRDEGKMVTSSLGQLSSGGTLSSGGAGNTNSSQLLSKLGKALNARLASHNARLAAAKKARNDFNKKWGNTRYARAGTPLANMSEDDLKKMMDNMKAASLKSATSANGAKAPGAAAGAGGPVAPPKQEIGPETKKEEIKTEGSHKSQSNDSGGGDSRSGGYYNNSSGGYARNDVGSGDAKANKNDIIEAVKKNPSKYNNEEGDSIFKIITNRYMKSLDRILPKE